MLVDTHCHIHESNYPLNADETLKRAQEAGVEALICVGTSLQSSREAIAFASVRENVFVSVGVHPHDTREGWGEIEKLASAQTSSTSQEAASAITGLAHSGVPFEDGGSSGSLSAQSTRGKESGEQEEEISSRPSSKIVAIGEIGLDYFYTHSPREVQLQALEEQINLALHYHLPIIFHVREAFSDFWPLFDNFHGIRGVLHSFTDTTVHMEEALKRGLSIGVNGISTFTRQEEQKAMFRAIPLDRLLLETDAPFLTPTPLRGKVNEPAFVRHVAEHHAHLRGISVEEIARNTTTNARALFALS